MPTYCYKCSDCGEVSDIRRAVADRDDLAGLSCGKCKSTSLVRVPPPSVGLVFRGTGWYKTDYPASGSRPAGQAPDPKSSP